MYKGATEENSASFESRNRSILLARSKLKVKPVPMKITPISGAPDQGHKTMRAGLGVGWREGEFFHEANFRLAFTICSIRNTAIRPARKSTRWE